MGNGTFQAKFNPLSQIEEIDQLYVVRKSPGPKIDKLTYIILPKICKYAPINLIITPLYLSYYALKLKPKYLIGYHFAMHAPFVYIASKLTGVPYIFCQTGADSQTYLYKPYIKYWVRKILNNCYYINTPGNESLKYWKDHDIKAPIQVLHSTIDTNVFKETNAIEKEYDFIFIGRLDPVKRIPLIFEGLKKLITENKNHTIKIAIVGDGPLKDELVALAKKMNIESNLDFVGFQLNVLPWLQKSKIFVMNSESEGLPVALMEAMSTKLVCVVPNINNIPSVIEDGKTGFLFNKDDQAMFAEKLKLAYDNYSEYDSLREAARQKIIDNYSYEVAQLKWSKIIL